MSILWAPVVMLKKFVRSSTPPKTSLTTVYSVEMIVVVSWDPVGACKTLTHNPSLGLTRKSISRLFPYDDSMVVIIDDRSDVWENSVNLIKVIPCKQFLPPLKNQCDCSLFPIKMISSSELGISMQHSFPRTPILSLLLPQLLTI